MQFTLGVLAAATAALTLGACGPGAGGNAGSGQGASSSPPEEAPSASALAAVRPPATFRGTLPCADCPGIRTTLELRADGAASLSRMYIEGEPDRDPVFVEKGRWTLDDQGHLVLTPTDGAPTLFAFAQDDLTALDGSGQPLPSSLPRVLQRVPDGDMGELAGTSWRFVDPARVADGPRLPTLSFAVDARLSGSDGCNLLMGTWSVADGHLELGSMATTRMACPGPVDATAQAIHAALEAAAGYTIEGSELHLLDTGSAVVARLRPAPTAISGAGHGSEAQSPSR